MTKMMMMMKKKKSLKFQFISLYPHPVMRCEDTAAIDVT